MPRRALPDGPATLFLRPTDITPVADPHGRWHVARCDSNGAALRIDLSDGATIIPFIYTQQHSRGELLRMMAIG